MAGGEAYYLHVLFRDKNIPPDEVYNKPPKVRAFMYASLEIGEEERKAAEKGAK